MRPKSLNHLNPATRHPTLALQLAINPALAKVLLNDGKREPFAMGLQSVGSEFRWPFQPSATGHGVSEVEL